MVEVIRTNVDRREHANMILDIIHTHFGHYIVNFDLQDCDRILRIKSTHIIQTEQLIQLIRSKGFVAEVLEDVIPPFEQSFRLIQLSESA